MPLSHVRRYSHNQRATCQTTVLTKDCLLQADSLLEDFEVAGDWTADLGGLAANVTQFYRGTQSIKLTTPAGSTGRMTRVINLTGVDAYEFVSLWYYIHDWTTTSSVKVILSSVADFSKTMYYIIAPGLHSLGAYPIGWQVYRMPISALGSSASSRECCRIF
jgi:hypothetical protein